MYRLYQLYPAALLGLCLLPLGCASSSEGDARTATSDQNGEPVVKIEELHEGTGAAAKLGDYVDVHYTGWLTDGTKFDSSLDRGQPIQLRLGAGQVIRGWEQGLEGMKLWGKRKLTIPPELAYGKQGRSGIPPNSTLVFEVELVGLK